MSKRAPRATFSNSIAGFEPGGQGRGGRSRHALLVGTALGASILVFSLAQPGTARADNECGLITVGSNDIAVCSPAGNTYPNGITYTDSGGNALSLIIEPGVVDTDLNTAMAVYALNTAGDAVIVAYSGDLISGSGHGLFAVTQGPNLALVESGATVTAAYGVGAYAKSAGGAAEVFNAGAVYASAQAVFAKALDGYGHVQNSGALSVSNANGEFAYGIYVGAETGIVSNTGNISVTGYFNAATGIHVSGTNGYLANSGAVTINNTEGLATGLSVSGEGGGAAVVRNTGDLSVYGYSHAKGIYAYGVTASVSSTGNISAISADGTAIAARVTSFGGYANLVLDGTIYARAEGGSYAYGALVTGNGDGRFELTGGSIYAKSDTGTAIGVGAYMSKGSAYVDTRAGTVRAYGETGATGIGATGDSVTVYSGAVYTKSTELNATGIAARASAGEVTIHGYGDITVNGYFGATGVSAQATSGAATVVIDGNVVANGYAAQATGVYAKSSDGADAYVRVDGSVRATGATGGIGVEVLGSGNATAYIGGNVVAYSGGFAPATGVSVTSYDGDALADVTGNVVVHGGNLAIGVATHGYNQTVVVGGDVYALSFDGSIGVEAIAGGNATVVVEGNVVARANYGEAIGVTASSTAGHTTTVTLGGVSASGIVAYGITTGDDGQSLIYVGSGGVDVNALYKAVGIAGTSGASTSTVTVIGDTTVTSAESAAYGLENASSLSSSLNSEGDVTVHGATYALGLKDSSGQNAYVQEFGNVTVTASDGPAHGVISVGSIYANVNLNGAINVTSQTNNAYGVLVDGFGGSTGQITGNVTVQGFSYAIGVLAESGAGAVNLNITGAVNASARYNAVGVRGLSYDYGSFITVNGPTTVTSTAGSAIGLENSSVVTNTLTSNGDVTVQGATYALGLKDSSGQNSYLNEVGNITVTATGASAVAQGVISVASLYANANLSGAISVTSEHGAAYGVTLSGYNGVNGQIAGSVSVQAHDYALGVFAESGAGDINLTGGADVSATSLYTNATAVRAVSPFTTGVALGNISASGFYNATGVYAVGHTVDVSLQSVDVHAVLGDAVGVETPSKYSPGGPPSESLSLAESYGASTTITVAGNVSAVSGHGNATGVYAYAYEGPVSVAIGGTTTATARYGNAIGVSAVSAGYYPGTVTVSTGDIHVSGYTGAIGVRANALGAYTAPYYQPCYADCYYGNYSGVKSNSLHDHNLYGFSGNTVTVTTGNVSAMSVNGVAVGVYATGANSVVHVAGNLTVYSVNGYAYGVESFTTGTGNVTVDGDISAITLGYTNAAGVVAEGYGDQSITTHGNIVAAAGSQAFGAYANSGGNASIHVDGSVYSHAGLATYGVMTRSQGSSTIYVGGDVTADAGPNTINFSYAYGVDAHTGGDADVHVGGNVTAYNPAGAAIGVQLYVGGNATVYVGGAVNATATSYRNAYGIFGSVSGNATVHAGSVQALGYENAYGVQIYATSANIDIVGNVVAIAQTGYAAGVSVEATYANVTVGGNVYARAFNGDAAGVAITTDDVAEVNVYGNVTAIAYGNASGVSVRSEGGIKGYVGGNVYAGAYDGNATGVSLEAIAVFATVVGNVTAKSQYGNATGVNVYSLEVAIVDVGGDVHASSSFGYATGVYAKSLKGYLGLTAGGNVLVTGYTGAAGVKTFNIKGYTYINVTGQVSAYAKDGDAYGVDTIGTANITVGAASAIAHGGSAYGVDSITPLGGDLSVNVAHDVYARSYGGNAVGVYASINGDYNFTGNIGGNVTAIADYSAHGVQITTDGSIYLGIGGDLVAVSYEGNATGGYLSAAGAASITVGGNVTVQAYGAAVGIDIENADTAYAGVGGVVHVVSLNGSATGVELYSYDENTAVLGGLVVISPGNARGIWEPYGVNNTAIVSGDVTVISTAGSASGIDSDAYDHNYVDVTGNMLVQGAGDSVGVHAEGNYFNIKVGGNLTVTSATGTAYGIMASGGHYDNYVTVGGSTYVRGFGRSVGVQAFSGSGLYIYTGAVAAISDTGEAYGIDATGCATVRVTTTGDVYAKGLESAYGVHAVSTLGDDAFVMVGGNATAISTDGNAIAVYVRGGYYASATVTGSVFAHAEYTATGVDLSAQGGVIDVMGGVEAISNDTIATGVKGVASLYDMSITVGGNVAAFAFGNATGVYGDAKEGHLTIDVGGNVYATSYAGYAVGIHAYSAALDKITVGGSVRAYGVDGATGVDLSGDGPVKANITDVVAATSSGGEAVGVYAHNDSYASLYLGGASAHGAADAFGVYVHVPGATYLTVTGDVTAVSTGANAMGVSIRTPSVVTVDIGGNVLARAPESAIGVYVASDSDVSVSAGAVYARSYNSTAYGIEIKTSGNIGANVVGDAVALAYGNATALWGNSSGGDVSLSAGGNVTAVSSGVTGNAIGIHAFAAEGYATVHGGTNTYASGAFLAAGLGAYGRSGAYVGATGNILAVSDTIAIGAQAIANYGNTTVDIGGVSIARGGYIAFGINAYSYHDNVSVTAGGAAAITTSTNALSTTIGVHATAAYGTVDVDVTGDVYASGSGTVFGVFAHGDLDTKASVGGNATALGYFYGATAVGVSSETGSAKAYVTGDVYAAAKYGTVHGVVASSPNFTRVEVDGSTTVRTVEGAAYGIKATGYGVRSYLGDVTAVSQDSYATGIRVSGGLYGETDVQGNVTVQAQSTAFGADITGGYTHAQVYGNVSVRSLTGNATGLYLNSSDEEANVFVSGNVFAAGQGSAYGVSVTAPAYSLIEVTGNVGAYSHYGPAIGVREIADYGKVIVGGNVTSMSDDGAAQGIAVSSPYANVKVTVGGNVFASGATNVQGVAVVEGYSGEVYVDGNITALAGSGVAVGVQVSNNTSTELESDHELVMVDGTVTAISTDGGATGISVADTATFGGGTVDVRAGNVSVEGALNAYGVNVQTHEATDVNVYGNATVISTTASAYGVLLNTTSDGSVEAGGNVVATGYGNATGVSVTAAGDGSVGITGSVGAYAHNGAAYGVKENSDGSVYIGGNATAMSDLANATAVSLYSTGAATVHVGQNVLASGAVNATGVYISGYTSATVYVGGNVTAQAGTGTAIGVQVLEGYHSPDPYHVDHESVQVLGDVTAISTTGSATGVLAHQYYSSFDSAVYVTVNGNVSAKAAQDAYGVSIDGNSTAFVHIYGNVTAISTGGDAYGVSVGVKGYASAQIGGDVSAFGAGNAYGVEVNAGSGGNVHVTGNATAKAYDGSAAAVSVTSSDAGATIYVGGSAYAYATGTAIGVHATANADASIDIVGSATARSTTGAATAAMAGGFDAYVTVGGNAKAIAYGNAVAVEAYAYNGNAAANVTGNVTAYSSHGNATGVLVSADYGYGNVSVGGDIFVQAPGRAYGVFDTGNVVNVTVGGNVIAISKGDGPATGVSVGAQNGVTVNVGGYVYASSQGVTRGVDSFTDNGVTTIDITGNVTAKSTDGDVTGVYAASGVNPGDGYIGGGNISVTVAGKTTAISYAGAAYGIDVRTPDDATVNVGDVMAYSHNGEATGVHVIGDSTIETGNVTAISVAGNARAVYGLSTGYLGVQVNGTAYAMSTDGHAMGIYMSSDGDSNLVVTGEVGARSIDSYATGVGIYTSGNSTGTISGNVSARAEGTATGVRDYSGNVNLTVTGEVVAVSTAGDATGLIANGDTVHASIGGAYVYSETGQAVGEQVNASYAFANTTGDVFVKAVVGNATGVYASGDATGAVHAVGNVTAVSTDAAAIGARATGTVYADVYVSGLATAVSMDGVATGAEAVSPNYARVEVGSAYAYSASLRAVGIAAYSAGNAVAIATGDVHAKSDGTEYHGSEGWGAYAHSTGGNASVTIGGNAVALATYSNAIGVRVIADGTAYANVTGAAIAYSTKSYAMGVDALGGNVSVHVGSAYAYGVGSAWGVHAIATGNVSITSTGDVFGKIGVGGKAVGAYADAGDYAYVNIGGNAVARTPNSSALGVQVIAASANVTVGGQVEAITNTGEAYGVQVTTTGAASVSVGGGYVYSHYFARGIEVTAGGDIYGGVSKGTLYVRTTNDTNTTTIGVDLYTTSGNITLGGAGNVRVVSDKRDAKGLYVETRAGNVSGSIGGDVTAIGVDATGISVHASGDATAGVGGNVVAYATEDSATGAAAYAGGTASVTIGGNVTAIALYTNSIARGAVAFGAGAGDGVGEVSIGGSLYVRGGTSFGAVADGSEGASVSIVGNTVVKGTYQAHGVYARSFYGGAVSVTTGNVSVIASDGYAVAISGNARGVAFAPYSENDVNGNVTVTVNGSVLAYGTTFAAGVNLFGTNGLSADVTGNLTVYGGNAPSYQRSYGPAYSAAGVVFRGGQGDSLTVGGTLLVQASGSVIGVDAYSLNGTYYAFAGEHTNVSISLGGLKAVSTGTDTSAFGALVNVGGNISVDVAGNTVVWGGDYAAGVRATSYGGGDVSVSLGNVMVGESGNATTDQAFGVYAETTGNISVDISGSTLVGGELATGVYSYSTGGGNITIDVGDVTVHQYAGYATDNNAGILAYTDGNVNLTAGNIAVTGNYIVGVRLSGHNFTPSGNITVSLGNVSTTGDHSPGFYLVTTGANANVTVGSTYTTGNYSDGVYLKALDGNGTVTVGNAITKGNYSDGAYVWAYGNASITAGMVYTKGAHSDGLYAYSEKGGVTVSANMVVTKGDYSQGIHAIAGGPVVVNNGVNVTYGAHSDAVYAKNNNTTPTDTVTVTSGTAVTHGIFSDAIYADGFYANSVTSTLAKTYGNHSIGIDAASVHGPVTVNSGTVYTKGVYSTGIDVVSGSAASVTANMTITKGDDSGGISVFAPGSAYVNSHYVRTYGDFAGGIGVESTDGPVNVVSYAVHTSGIFSTGIAASAVYGDVSVTSTQVIVDGSYGFGIVATTLTGNSTVSSGYVRTSGANDDGIVASTNAGTVTVTSGGVVTYGGYSAGIVAASYVGNVLVTSTYAATHGDHSTAVYGGTASGVVTINSNTAKTFGDYSTAVVGKNLLGDVSITATYVATHGYYSDGVDGISSSGNVSIHVGTAKTYGDNSYGAYGYSKTGNVYVGVTAALTHGNLSTGVSAYAYAGNASIGSSYVRTYGAHAAGLFARAGGDASVVANTVITSGDYSTGVVVEATGNASASSNYVHTAGFHSDGVYVEGGASATVNNAGYVETTGNHSVGIVAVSGAGSAAVTSKTVITSGAYADGIESDGYAGASVNSTNAVKTTGYDARGIVANTYRDAVTVTSNAVLTYGKDSLGILAFSIYGDVDVTSTMVYTAGAHAGGIAAESGFGNVNITSDHVVTKGDYSTGVYGDALYGGTTTVHSTDVRTYGNHSVGIEGVGYSGLSIYSDQIVTHGNYSAAIHAVSYTGDALVSTTGATLTYGADSDAIYAGISTSGNVSVLVGGMVDAYDGVGVHINAQGGAAYVLNHSRIYGGRGGIVAYSATGTTVENYGAIAGGQGYAMGISGGGAVVDNHGSIYGYAHFTANNDTVNNAGRWFAYGDTSFGAGTDTFNNTNAVLVAPFSSSAVTVNWTGLEVFNNSGLVDLRNGHAGDIFDLTSDTGGTAWNGTGASTLGVDVAFSANLISDKLIVGAVSGTTALAVTDVTPGQAGMINMTGTTVVQGSSGAASDFTWAGFKKGFIDYELKFFSSSNSVIWNIVALPDNAAFEMLKAPAMAQDFWTRSGDTWSDREQEVRDSMWGSTPPTRGEGWEMWANAVGGGENVGRTETLNSSSGPFTADLSTNTTWGGFQMGGDNWTSKNWLWGFTAGFVDQNSAFKLDKNSFDITGWNVGAYGGFTSGSFFANALLKGDWYNVQANMHTVPAIETFQGNTWGAKGETGWRLGGPALYFEPRADIAWTSTHLDNANFSAQSTVFSFGDATSAKGSIGARIGGQWGSTLPYVGIYAVDEFDGKNRMSMITGSGCPSCMSVEDLRPGSYEKAEFGFTTTSWNGLEGFAKGDADFGGHTSGFTGTLGVRWQW